MAEKIEIKKELTESDFNQIVAEFQKSIQNQDNVDDLGQSFRELVKKITPAKEVHFLLPLEKGRRLETVAVEKNITIDISSSKSLLAKCTQTKEALFSNDISRDTDYNKEIDNFLGYPLKNLLLVPLLLEDNEVMGIIWAAIPQKDLNQYMLSDIKYLVQITASCIEELEDIHRKSEQKDSTSVVSKIRSWLFN